MAPSTSIRRACSGRLRSLHRRRRRQTLLHALIHRPAALAVRLDLALRALVTRVLGPHLAGRGLVEARLDADAAAAAGRDAARADDGVTLLGRRRRLLRDRIDRTGGGLATTTRNEEDNERESLHASDS